MLGIYTSATMTVGNLVDLNDFATGDGSTKTFPFSNKAPTAVAPVVQTRAAQYYQFNGGFTKDSIGDTITLPNAPAAATPVIIPGLIRVQFRAYDQPTVLGTSTPNVGKTLFWLADPVDIGVYQWVKTIGQTGIMITPIDHDTLGGASASWLQLAPMMPDGSEGTYGAPGTGISLGDLSAADQLQANVSALDTSCTVANGSQFTAGQYIMINPGGANQEVRRIISISGGTLNTTSFDNNHLAGEAVYANGWGIWGMLTLPTTATGMHNWYDVTLDTLWDGISR